MSISERCQKALLLAIEGELKRGEELALTLLPWIDPYPFTTLWTPEAEYDEAEALLSFSLLLRAFKEEEKGEKLFERALAVRGELSPFFSWLAQKEVRFSAPGKRGEGRGGLTSEGRGTSLGAFAFGEVEVRALGPQGFPLSHPSLFGIESKGQSGGEGWVASTASLETWFGVEERGDQIRCRFLGLSPERPLAWVFYVRAKEAKVGGQTFLPKSLTRYKGAGERVTFGGSLSIESSPSCPIELIPLAGEGAFWGSDFLLAYELSSLEEGGSPFQEVAFHFKRSPSV